MEYIDPKQSQAVWSRVMGHPVAPPKTLPEILAEYTIHVRRSQGLYRQIATTAKGNLQRPAQALHQLSSSQVRQLGALYFLIQGASLPSQPRQYVHIDCLTKTLQRQYQVGKELQEQFQFSGRTYAEFATFFQNLSREQGKIQRILMDLVTSRL